MPVVGDLVQSIHGKTIAEEPERGLSPNSPRVKLDEPTMRYTRAAYYGMINHIDDQIGRLTMSLQRRNLLGNTFILFTSDHGEMLGDHNLYRKTFAYEGSARVPYIARAAPTMDYPQEVTTFAPVGLQDVMPTLLDVAGVPIPETLTGRSLLPLMRGEDMGWRDALHGEHAGCYQYDDGVHFLTNGHYKYLWYSQTGQEQLFNLDDDPNELHDLSRNGNSDVASWRSRMAQELQDRPEGFSDGTHLIVGRPHEHLVPGR
jgi:arylsulfatase A-like enzyme